MLSYGDDGNKYRYISPRIVKDDYKVYYFYSKGECLLVYGYGFIDTAVLQLDALHQLLEKVGVRWEYGSAAPATYIKTLAKYYAVETCIHDDYKKAIDANLKAQQDLTNQWYADIYTHYGIDPDDPIVQLVMSKAWEDGHSSGLQEVDHYIDKYLEFVENIAKVADKSKLFKQVS